MRGKREVILEMRGIGKSFPGVKALDDVSFSLAKGECHALLGENGAGKSTLMKILSGIYVPDAGTMELDGRPAIFRDTNAARAAGVSIIHQELNICENLTVAANLFLGREKCGFLGRIDKRHAVERTREMLGGLGLDIDPGAVMSTLSPAAKQMVEIAKAVSQNARVIVMDEPTSSLTAAEEEVLFGLVRRLKAQGVAIVYISHKLPEIFRVCDRVTVLRDGSCIGSRDIADVDSDRLVEMMVGRSIDAVYPPASARTDAPILFEARGVRSAGKVEESSFVLRRGEILGFAGLVGSGRTEMVKLIFGCHRLDGGEFFLDGRRLASGSPRRAIRNGIALVPEDRKLEGLSLGLSVTENIAAANYHSISRRGVVRKGRVRTLVESGIARLRIKTPGGHTLVRSLSGGNQQKVILARWLARNLKVLILDEPTRGIDIGAKAEIYAIMRELAARGVGIIMVSSELPEVLGMSDRVAVMRSKRIVAMLDRAEASQEAVMKYAAGGLDMPSPAGNADGRRNG